MGTGEGMIQVKDIDVEGPVMGILNPQDGSGTGKHRATVDLMVWHEDAA